SGECDALVLGFPSLQRGSGLRWLLPVAGLLLLALLATAICMAVPKGDDYAQRQRVTKPPFAADSGQHVPPVGDNGKTDPDTKTNGKPDPDPDTKTNGKIDPDTKTDKPGVGKTGDVPSAVNPKSTK